ncbi:hypothetical protein P7C73_g3178, partial [Tremellales sp. Uapishka_1]
MGRLIDLPTRDVSLYVRISAPGNRTADAINVNFPTILLLHPIWVDGFFFYPQCDDPLFHENYNLVCIDLRGHGASECRSNERPFDFWACAEDVHAVVERLGVFDFHLVGCSTGSVAALKYTSRHAARVKSLTLVSLPPREEVADIELAYKELHDTLIEAVTHEDEEDLDRLTLATFSFGVSAFSNDAIRELRAEYMGLARQRFKKDTIKETAYWILNPMMKRVPWTREDVESISCPVLILQGTADEFCHLEDNRILGSWINDRQYASLGERPRAVVEEIPNVPHWMTLTSPNIVNPIIYNFIQETSVPALPPSPFSPLFAPSITRRPSTPRDVAAFIIPPPPNLPAGTLTLGDMLAKEVANISVTTEVSVHVEAEEA